MLTSRDIALKAGVSPSTVSRAFDPDSPISKETRDKILKISKEMGYSPNILASSLKTKNSGLIGVIFTDSSNNFLSSVLKDLAFHADLYGYRVIVMYSNDNAVIEAKHLQAMLSLGVDGVILMPAMFSNNSATQQVLAQYKYQNIPVLQCFARINSNLHTFSIDDRMSSFAATKLLLNMGHRNIIFADNKKNVISDSKITGYNTAYEQCGIPCKRDFIMQVPSYVDPKNVLKEQIKELKATAIITANESLTISALKAFKELNYSYPDDISIISFDDSEWLSLLNITAIAVPSGEVGSRMASLLINELIKASYQEPYIFSEIEPILINRNSVKNLQK